MKVRLLWIIGGVFAAVLTAVAAGPVGATGHPDKPEMESAARQDLQPALPAAQPPSSGDTLAFNPPESPGPGKTTDEPSDAALGDQPDDTVASAQDDTAPAMDDSGKPSPEPDTPSSNGRPIALPFSLNGNGFQFQVTSTQDEGDDSVENRDSAAGDPENGNGDIPEPGRSIHEHADGHHLESLSVPDIVAEDENTEKEGPQDEESVSGAPGEAKPGEEVTEVEPEQALPGAGTAEEIEEPGPAAPETVVSDQPLPLPHSVEGDEFDFPSSPGIERQKEFWIEIFTRYDSHQGVLHDGRIALPVYESIELEGLRYRSQMRFVRKRKRVLTGALRGLAADMEAGRELDEDQQTLMAKLPEGSTPDDIRDFAHNVRFQRGLADRFRKGIIRSGALLQHMRVFMERHGVPTDLVYLPHVESTFNNATRSKAGAVGIWQFTRGTGRRYMTVGYEVDERLDPLVAAEAAAKFLRKNYETLGTWPLAITAYNHGPNSLRRIIKREGSTDLGYLIENYNGRLFKFASKNFYAEFLAAREVARNPKAYFGELELEEPWRYAMLPELPFYLDVDRAAETFGVSRDELRRLNPALRSAVWSGTKYIPKGYRLRLPAHAAPEGKVEQMLADLPDQHRMDRQKRSEYVRVRRGDTLYSIGRRLGISWRKIAHANNIASYHRLMPGKKLIIPWDGKNIDALRAKLAEERQETEPASARIVARIPVRTDEELRAAAEAGAAGHSSQFQELRIINYDVRRKDGEIVTAYGETLGKYAEWASVPIWEIRRLNGLSSRRRLRTGMNLLIPLDNVSREIFDQRRLAFHSEREANFFAEYNITAKVKVEVRPGQSPWNLAQENNVPMWLFYRENPELLKSPLKVGMQVILPVVVAGVR